jgi:predicted nucleic acid-binding protein
MAEILVDTSAVFALVDRSDANHAAAVGALRTLRGRRTNPILTNFIVAESHALLLARIGADIARQWLRANVWTIDRVTEDDEREARHTIERYTDKTFSYTDATSFAVMKRRGIRTALAFDAHFRQYGFQLLP